MVFNPLSDKYILAFENRLKSAWIYTKKVDKKMNTKI